MLCPAACLLFQAAALTAVEEREKNSKQDGTLRWLLEQGYAAWIESSDHLNSMDGIMLFMKLASFRSSYELTGPAWLESLAPKIQREALEWYGSDLNKLPQFISAMLDVPDKKIRRNGEAGCVTRRLTRRDLKAFGQLVQRRLAEPLSDAISL